MSKKSLTIKMCLFHKAGLQDVSHFRLVFLYERLNITICGYLILYIWKLGPITEEKQELDNLLQTVISPRLSGFSCTYWVRNTVGKHLLYSLCWRQRRSLLMVTRLFIVLSLTLPLKSLCREDKGQRLVDPSNLAQKQSSGSSWSELNTPGRVF